MPFAVYAAALRAPIKNKISYKNPPFVWAAHKRRVKGGPKKFSFLCSAGPQGLLVFFCPGEKNIKSVFLPAFLSGRKAGTHTATFCPLFFSPEEKPPPGQTLCRFCNPKGIKKEPRTGALLYAKFIFTGRRYGRNFPACCLWPAGACPSFCRPVPPHFWHWV